MAYYALTVDEVLQVVRSWNPKRSITWLHLHHSIAPFSGAADLGKMADRTTSRRLPQHLTIDRAGQIWTGRHWELAPASIANHNEGAFSIVLAGDFSREQLENAQRTTAIAVIAALVQQLGLSERDVVFHSERDASSDCPGATIDLNAFRAAVAAQKAVVQAPLPPRVAGPFSPEYSAAAALLQDLTRDPGELDEPAAEQPGEQLMRDTIESVRTPGSRDTSAPLPRKLTEETMVELRPHVVNLTQGLLSSGGRYKTRPHHLDEMFNVSIPAYINECRSHGRVPRLVFFAHGGLNPEEVGLEGALNQLQWWRDNHMYPVFFVWETGLLQSLRFLIRPQEGTRNIFSDNVSDPLIERTAHAIGGVSIWGNMKQAAERAATHPQGGSNLVAKKVAGLMTQHGDVQVHTIGHSAGSIFHAHFVRALYDHHQAPRDVSSMHFLAPALRVDEFKRLLMPRVGQDKGVAALSVFTMRSDLEENDTCIKAYRKSLLCLIRGGLEPRRNTPLLGLEDSIGDDPDLLSFFGIDGSVPKADLIFSLSPANAPLERRTTAKQHGAFDNNVDTMNSVARRIVGPALADTLKSFATSSAAERAFEEDPFLGLPEDIRLFLTGSTQPTPPVIEVLPQRPQPQPQLQPQSAGGRRRALCVGINDYGPQSLQFCIADAELWARSFERHNFETRLLTDMHATRETILGTLEDLVRDSVAGDMIALQFAGHGTRAQDVDGDEMKSGIDFGYVPFDFNSGALVLDDDIFAIWRQLKEGVTAVSFFDACHSGNGLRMLARGTRSALQRRARFITLTPEQQRKHLDFRQARASRTSATRAAEIPGNVVFFSACAEAEVALESDGNGDFTRIAAVELANASTLTNRSYQAKVLSAFGATPTQTPQWDAAPDGRKAEIGEQPFLQPIRSTLPSTAAARTRGLSLTKTEWRRDTRSPLAVT
jgi:pimeloyl-ACP methyl ester carboxylesterase